MTTYVYETIPRMPGEEPRRFEVRQSMNDQPLANHPETGEPVRRVVLGGFGIKTSAKPQRPSRPPSGHSCCGGGCGCH